MAHRKLSDPNPIPVSEEERQAYFLDRAADAWQEFVLNSRPSALAKYLKAGGEVDEDVRSALIELLKDDPRGNPGGAKPFRDFETYVSVNLMVRVDNLSRALNAGDSPKGKKKLSTRQALIRYAEMTNQELRTVEMRYKRGEKISNSFQ